MIKLKYYLSWLIVVFLIVGSLSSLSEVYNHIKLEMLNSSIKNAIVEFYNLNCVYPATLEELEEYFDISLKLDGYVVRYNVFAKNVTPSIDILEETSNVC